MKKFAKNATFLTSVGFLSASILLLCAGTVAPVLASILNVDDTNAFLYEDAYGNTFKCFHFKNDGETLVTGVAIAWGDDADKTPTHLIVPQTVSNNGVSYTVRAVAKHGFRYCDFEEITLPNTIEKVEEEAFAYCMNLKTFVYPYLVEEIAPSTFIDCRKLESISYLDADGDPSFGSDKITSIGDHAFDSCVLLREFYSPKNLVYYGQSCFKNCRSLVNYYFPSAQYDTDGETVLNPITVREYAFSDCKQLVYVYFEDNVKEIDNYAFTDTSLDLHIKYTGDEIPTYFKEGVNQSHWRDFYIATDKTELVPVDIEHPRILPDDTYPCLRYVLSSDTVDLDAAQGRATVKVIDQAEIDQDGEYAIIYKFDTPIRNVPGCFDVASGTLTIPETIANKKVKVIQSSAFANNPYIKSVKFSENLVQICNRAFVNCTNIASLDFSECEKLKEVSYHVFTEYDYDNIIPNRALTSLMLPDCLEYIGGYAFALLYSVNQFKLPNNVKAIDDLAFFRLGFEIADNAGLVDLKLPKSLNDADAKAANFLHLSKEYEHNKYYEHKNYTRFYAIGKYAFQEAGCIRSAYMEDDPDHANDNTYTTSLYSNVFHTAKNLLSFKANKNLQFLGKDNFKKCYRLREVFLTTAKSNAATVDKNYPWCIDEENGSYGGTLFFENLPELVCYVDGAKAPGKLEEYSLSKEGSGQLNSMWNSETTVAYTNESKQNSNLSRNIIPTYYNCDTSSVKYWNPTTKDFVAAPVSYEDYQNGVIAFAQNTVTEKYSVTRYYCDASGGKGVALIDLTDIEDISDDSTHDLEVIGDTCFAVSGQLTGGNGNSNRAPGLYFILPDTITKIGDRAFYRKTGNKDKDDDDLKGNGRFGARIITYKNSEGNYLLENGTAGSYSDITAAINTINGSLDADKRGYCVLPNQVTSIGKLAFYNNIFRTVRITSTLSYFGVGAFYCHTLRTNNALGVTETFVMSSNTGPFEVSDNGLYFKGISGKEMLVSQTNGNTGTLNIKEGTKAVGLMACAETKYTSINLPDSLQTIYGMGFAHNHKLETVTGGAGLRYIGTMKNYRNKTDTDWDDPDYTEIWDSSVAEYFENYDYRDYAWYTRKIIDNLSSAFFGCKKLSTLDFTSLTELRKIGAQAFYDCSALENMAGDNEYVYKKYNASDGSLVEITGRTSNSKNVLDLSNNMNLRSIDRGAFVNCSKIKYLHLPDIKNSEGTKSAIFVGKDAELDAGNGNIFHKTTGDGYITILVGETAFYADPNFGTDHNAAYHYPKGIFGENNRVYYFISKKADIPEGTSGTDLRYWTRGSDGSYILIDSAKDAHKYFPE